MAVYLGISPDHASNIPLVLSTRTSLVSYQYHVVYDDHFMTTRSRTNAMPFSWTDLFKHKAENVLADNPDKAAADNLGPD